ncbi:MAG: glyoxalase-like domain protein [Inquilinus sp.]|nr:glyoxalase-like domain protein [Inquilinus sp.]
MAVELDHVFMFVSPGAPEAVALSRMGMRQAYSRRHPGQGTANVCFAFDNAYLELLWAEDPDELASPAVAPTGLAERADWRAYRASPFGIAVRTSETGIPLPFATWDYAAPFLPEGETIAVAKASEDPKQPFLFRSPGDERPDQWRDFRAGARQRPIGLAEIIGLRLDFPPSVEPAPAFDALARQRLLTVASSGVGPRMTLTLSRTKDAPPKRLILPDMSLVE